MEMKEKQDYSDLMEKANKDHVYATDLKRQ